MRHFAELHDDLGGVRAEPLARAQVERHAGPAPVRHLGLQRHERLRVAGPVEFVQVARHGLAVDQACGVLAAHGLPERGRPGQRAQRLQHLQLLVTHGLAVQHRRRFHGHQAQQLQQVVLHHVAQRAGAVVVVGAAADADGLGHRYLDVVDVPRVPQRLEQRVGEPQHEQVLHGLLAEVVVDPEDLLFREHRADLVVDRAGRGEVVADRLLQHDPGRGVDQPVGRGPRADRAEQPWRAGEVEHADARGVAECRGERGPVGVVDHVQRDVVQPREEPGAGRVGRIADVPLQLGVDLVAEARVVEARAGDREDPRLVRQLAVAITEVEGRQQLAHGEVAGAAENQEVARGDGGQVRQSRLQVSSRSDRPRRRSADTSSR